MAQVVVRALVVDSLAMRMPAPRISAPRIHVLGYRSLCPGTLSFHTTNLDGLRPQVFHTIVREIVFSLWLIPAFPYQSYNYEPLPILKPVFRA